MNQAMQKSRTTQLSMAAVFTALVFVATTIFSVYVPQTRGFFNIGEVMVFTTALLFGPIIGSFAGGVGSMLADLFLGYWYYAPATLVIKACEGGLVGILSRRKLTKLTKFQWRAFTFLMGLVIGVLLAGIGSIYYSGHVELYFGLPPASSPALALDVPSEIWYVLGAIVLLLFAFSGFVLEPESGWLTFTVLIGGLTMVAGYFLYQQLLIGPLFGISVLAIAEIPINIGQMLVGLVASIPIVRTIWRSLPSLKA
jgi:uncharacterized membrane protein